MTENGRRRNKIFVGGISWKADEESLSNYFSSFGNVVDCKIIMDKQTGKSKGYGFITFESEESVERVKNSDNLHFLGKTMNIGDAVRRNDSGGFKSSGKYYQDGGLQEFQQPYMIPQPYGFNPYLNPAYYPPHYYPYQYPQYAFSNNPMQGWTEAQSPESVNEDNSQISPNQMPRGAYPIGMIYYPPPQDYETLQQNLQTFQETLQKQKEANQANEEEQS